MVVLCQLEPSGAQDTAVDIGVLAFRGDAAAVRMWTSTASYLTRRIPAHAFRVVPLDLKGMRDHVRDGKLDFVLTNTGNYVDLEARFGITRIATLKNLRQGNAYTQFGAVIFTRADHPAVNSIADLGGHTFMAVSRDAFGGFQMAWRELLRHRIDPFRDLAAIRFAGFPQDEIVYAVARGEVDAGTVRTDVIERMAQEGKIELSGFRVLNPRSTPGFPFLHSTDLYPEWPFAKLRHTPERLAEQLAVALLELPAISEAAIAARSAGWTIPLDYGPVHELFRVLRIGPYAHLNQLSLRRVWQEYGAWLAAALLAICMLGGFSAWMVRTNRRIAREVAERIQAQQQLAAYSNSLERRVGERTRALAELNLALQQSDATLRAMHDITAAPGVRLDDKLRELLDIGCRHFDCSCGVLAEHEAGQWRVRQRSASCRLLPLGPAAPEANALLGAALNCAETLCVPDVADQRQAGSTAFASHGVQSLIATRVTVEGQDIGTLSFFHQGVRKEPFTQVDVDILLLMAQWIGGETERELANERLQVHQHRLAHVARVNTMGEMASGIAHELNQPLTAILNYSRGGLRRLRNAGDPGTVVNGLTKISAEAERAAQIIRRLREFLRPGELQNEAVDLGVVAETVAQMAGAQMREHQVELALAGAADVPLVSGDRIQLEQVLLNLVRNAIDALDAVDRGHKRIVVEFETLERDRVQVCVRDNGCGITDPNLDQVFLPFYTTKPHGMGMGLSIIRSIIEAHNGDVTVESEAGKGTCFAFTVPAWDGRPRAATAAPAEAVSL